MSDIQISDAESKVMKILWSKNPLGADEIIQALASEQEWQETTIKTLLNRLLKKGAISAVKESRRFLYSPNLKKEQWLNIESRSLLDRLFNGKIAPMVAHFSQQKKLTKKDIAELRKLIEELDNEK